MILRLFLCLMIVISYSFAQEDTNFSSLIATGSPKEFQKYLDTTFVNLNRINPTNNYSLLMETLFEGNTPLAEFLIDKDVDINYISPSNETALTLATKYGHINVVKKLIEKGSDLHFTNQCGTPLVIASRHGFEKLVDIFIEKPQIDINGKDSKLNTAVMWASYNGYLPIVKNFIKHNASLSNQNIDLHTALDLAIIRNHKTIIELLLEQSTNNLNKRDAELFTPLMLASKYGNKDALTILFKYQPRLDAVDTNRNNVLHIAGVNNQFNIIQTLIDEGINPNRPNKDGDTVLHIASKYEFEKIIETLMTNTNINIHLTNNQGQTALDIVKQKRNTYLIDIISNYTTNQNNPPK